MKIFKLLGMALIAVACCLGFSSCGDDDEKVPEQAKNAQSYIGIQNATFVQNNIPAITDTDTQIEATTNSSALAGGANIVSVSSPVELQKFFVAIDGLAGYYEIPASEATRADASTHVYNFTINYTTELDKNVTIIINAQTADNSIVGVSRQTVTYVESQSGDLTINLVFDQDKDVDLHLFMPEGALIDHIYYGNRGIYAEGTDLDALEDALWNELLAKYGLPEDIDEDDIESEEFWLEYETRYAELYKTNLLSGLDHDSNPSCYIDGLDNENIVIKAQHLVPGTYKVYINMFENCAPQEKATRWTCITRFNDNIITASKGANPTSGKFEADAPSNSSDNIEDMVLATEFTLTQQDIAAAQASTRAATSKVVALAGINQLAMMKLMDSGRWDNMKHQRRIRK